MLGSVEVLVVVIVARFDHDHVQPCARQHSRGGGAAGARADDHHVALEARVAFDRGRF
jgi:hypothetical protein